MVPVLPQAPPGFESAALPYASIAYPEDWILLDTSPLVPLGVAQPEVLSGAVLQLANFDPDLPHSPRCMVDPDALPPEGVLLTVGIVTPREPSSSASPAVRGRSTRASRTTRIRSARTGLAHASRPWTAPSGAIYWANAAQERGRQRGRRPIDGAGVREPRLPRDRRTADVPDGRLPGPGTPRVVLGTERIGEGLATIVAFVELNKSLLVGISGSEGGSCCTGSAFAPHSGARATRDSTITLTNEGPSSPG